MDIGRVRLFDRSKGWGFIQRDKDRADVFVHWSEVQGREQGNLFTGERVEFAVEEGQRGLVARDVRVI